MNTALRGARDIGVALVVAATVAAAARGQDAFGAVYGTLTKEAFGSWVAPMGGDVDGDGVPDFATYSDSTFPYYTGPARLAVISGATLLRIWEVDAAYLVTYPNLDRAAVVGDVDGDQIPDLVSVEVPAGKPGQAILLRSGADGHVLKNLVTFANSDLVVDIHDVGDLDGDGARDFVVGRLTYSQFFAYSSRTGSQLWHHGLSAGTGLLDVAELGDVDGDGVSDLVRVGNGTSAEILSGATGKLIRKVDESNFSNAGQFGFAVAPLGDVNGDGIPDFVVSGLDNTWANRHLWAISGADGSLIWETGSTGSSDPWGAKVRAIGDVDGDGVTELLVGADQQNLVVAVKLLSGATGVLIDQYAPPQRSFFGNYNYNAMGWGFALAGIGDLDGDGVPEFAIGDFGWCDFPNGQTGAVIVYNVKAQDPAAGVNALLVDVHGHGAFTNIQDAVNAAVDGDLILVRPGTYPGFTLSKRVMIDATSLPPSIDGDITLNAIAPGTAPAGLRDLNAEEFPWGEGVVTVKDCSGEVVLERVRCGMAAFATAHFEILRSPNVALTDCIGSTQPGVAITDSSVRASDLRIDQTDPAIANADGAPALSATNSTVILTRPALRGGVGGAGSCNPYTHQWVPPFNGGPGIIADASSLTILGNGTDFVTGGGGGAPALPCDTKLGDGGDGIVLANGADVTISRVALAGGSGNADGADWSGTGTFTRSDKLPHLRLADPLRIGRSTQLALDSVETGHVLLVVSTVGGFMPLRSFVGPPLSVLPGPGFMLASLGATDAAGQLNLTATLPHDVTLVGSQLELQCALFATSGTAYLTNSVTRAVGL